MAIIGENISMHSFGEYLWSDGDGWGSGYGYGYGNQGMETAVVTGMKTWTEMRWRFR